MTETGSHGVHQSTTGFSGALRFCSECGEPITEVRLKANPNAEQCVPCLQSIGDVPRLKRFDQTTRDEVVPVMYLDSNQALESALRRSNHEIPPDAAFDIAVGDDSHLVREMEAVDSATPYHEYATEEEGEEEEGVQHRTHYVQSDEGREKKGAAARRMWRKRKAKIVEMPPPVQAAERLLTA